MTDETPGLDLTSFRRWYDGQRPGEIRGDLSAELIAGGKSNLTYTLTDGASSWIVRRPPLGHVQATAHDMGREFRVLCVLDERDPELGERGEDRSREFRSGDRRPVVGESNRARGDHARQVGDGLARPADGRCANLSDAA